MKSIFLTLLFSSTYFCAFAAEPGNLAPYLRSGDEGVLCADTGNNPRHFCFASNSGAKSNCIARGLRLPTIKEIALALNPEGVSDLPRDGYTKIEVVDGSIAPFYYNRTTYLTPSPEQDRASIWSSTLGPRGHYYFDVDDDGGLQQESVYSPYPTDFAIRCLAE